MADVGDIGATFERFKAAVNKKDSAAAKRLLSALKLKLIQLPALPPKFEQTPSAAEELTLARDILEHAVLFSVQLQDEAAFERNFSQLNVYYTDARQQIELSPREGCIMGLNLLRLLVQNRIAEFHTELELIPSEVRLGPCVTYITQLECWLMEGAYNKVLAARAGVPDPSYAPFMERLLMTVRDEIAGCSERAYASLPVADAERLLLFPSSKEALEYAAERGWRVEGGLVHFQAPEEGEAPELPSVALISHALTYARELERIV